MEGTRGAGELAVVVAGLPCHGSVLEAQRRQGSYPLDRIPALLARFAGHGTGLSLPGTRRTFAGKWMSGEPPHPQESLAEEGGSITPGVPLLRRADFPTARSGRALQRHIDHCSALSQDSVSSLVAWAHPLTVSRRSQVLCNGSQAACSPPRRARCLPACYNPRCFVPFLVSMLPHLRCLLASALALLFRPFFYLSPIHIFALQVNFASWALGGASVCSQHSSSICHIHPASSTQPPPPPTPLPGLPPFT